MSLTSQYPGLIPIGIFCLAIGLIVWLLFREESKEVKNCEQQREAILHYVFSQALKQEVLKRYPHLSAEHVELAFEQLRLYFLICRRHAPRAIAMPSKLVDACWHCFICDTRAYQQFCSDNFGNFLHHEPHVIGFVNSADLDKQDDHHPDSAQDKGSNARKAIEATDEGKSALKTANANLLAGARAYQWAAALESDNEPVDLPETPGHELTDKVPVLFSIDADLKIADGYFYADEFLRLLAHFDIKAAETAASNDDSSGGGSLSMGCADGSGAISCGGCGGSH